MNEESTSSSRKRKLPIGKMFLIILAVLLVAYAAVMTVMNRNLVAQRDNQAKQELVRNQLPAQACGVLSPTLVRETIGDPLQRASRTVEGKAFEDGCTYTNPNNSNQYASMVIKTYPNNQEAIDAFAEDRKLRIESENRDPGPHGDEMYYSAGSFFVLRGNKSFSVGAAKEGVTQEQQEAFSRKLLEQVGPNISL